MPRFLLGRRAGFGAAARHYVGDLVYGANDGIITTFAVVAGVAGAELATSTVLILGFANLLADGFSMGASNFLAIRSREDVRAAGEPLDRGATAPAGDEPRAADRLTRSRGDSRVAAETHAEAGAEPATLASHHDGPGPERPLRHGFATFAAFLIAGTIPLVAYLLPIESARRFAAATTLTLATLFVVGALRNFVTRRGWWRSGSEMLAVGAVAALVAYVVGAFLARVVGGAGAA